MMNVTADDGAGQAARAAALTTPIAGPDDPQLTARLLQLLGSHAAGMWLLSDADPSVSYLREGSEVRYLDLQGAGRVLVICLDGAEADAPAGLATLQPVPGYCRACGCSAFNACVDGVGESCRWVEPDLCSACAGKGGAQ
jgi:hypothetical protein